MKIFFLKKRIFYFLAICIMAIFSSSLLLLPVAFGQPSIIELMEKLMPSIVDITVENTAMAQSPRVAAAIDKRTGKVILRRNVRAAHYKRTAAGVILDSSGIIVTNYHTIGKNDTATVTLRDSAPITAKIILVFPQEDLAFLQIEPPYPLAAVELADSGNLKLKDDIYTIGHSETLDQTISEGTVIGIGTAHAKEQQATNETDLIQVNINVYKGDSGGPLFNHEGQLIGLMVAGQIKKDKSSFAIPSNKIQKRYLECLTMLHKKQ